MRRIPAAVSRLAFTGSLAVFTVAAFANSLAAQTPANSETKSKATVKASAPVAGSSVPNAVRDLPVRKVVLYKNGVGYFEHAGQVNGNQRVAIDFSSSQLNDVLQSLTVLDEGGGRVAAVNYNSTTPIEQQLRTLALGLKDFPATIAIYQSLRGQRVEVTGAGAPFTGKLVNIEFRKETDKNGQTSDDHNFLIVETDAGALRTAELTDAVSVRMVDPALQKQFASYLDIVASAQNQQVRHLVLEDRGAGQRRLQVSYISEVPVWKSTYRIVFPREANGNATMQGWAVVDNTVGADWDNVQLSLVAGAPQSFIQPLSQPIYTHRPEIPIATGQQFAPQTHEAADMKGGEGISGVVTDQSGAVIPNATVTATSPVTGIRVTRQTGNDGSYSLAPLVPGQYELTVDANGFQRFVERNIEVNGSMTANASLNVGSSSQTVTVNASGLALKTPSRGVMGMVARGGGFIAGAGAPAPVPGGVGYGGGVYRPSDAIAEGDVSSSGFDDFFQYSLAQTVTIHKNESAMVPILQQDLPAEHVTLWSERSRTPLRAVWLENSSKLTLDSGSFSIFENGEFAGEGLLDPIHPGEKRLVSYAADQAVHVQVASRENTRTLQHLRILKGVVIETHMGVASVTYSATNSGDTDRVLLIEHPKQTNGWTLDESIKPAETTPNLYRLRMAVGAHATEKLVVRERGPESTTVVLTADSDQSNYLLDLVKRVPDALEKLKPLMDAQGALVELDQQIEALQAEEQTATEDEARDRDNLTALKGSDAAKRFVDELNHAEDKLQATRKQTADLQKQRQAAVEKLNEQISEISFDWDVTKK